MLEQYLPVYYSDPFLKYRPFPQQESEYRAINHWHEIVAMTLFYTMIQKLSPIVSKKFMGRTYTDLDVKTRLNFDIHVVSMFQCILSLIMIVPMWNHEFIQNRANNHEDAVCGYYPYGGLVTAATVGYFIWDFSICAYNYKLFGIGFLFHGFAALIVFGGGLIAYLMPWVPGFLLFEASTPFVNLNWFASRLPAGYISETIVVINGLLLIGIFFSVRIVWGFYAVFLVAEDLFASSAPALFTYYTLTFNFFMDVLNLFWFYKMVMIAKKKLTANKDTKKLAKEAAEKLETVEPIEGVNKLD